MADITLADFSVLCSFCDPGIEASKLQPTSADEYPEAFKEIYDSSLVAGAAQIEAPILTQLIEEHELDLPKNAEQEIEDPLEFLESCQQMELIAHSADMRALRVSLPEFPATATAPTQPQDTAELIQFSEIVSQQPGQLEELAQINAAQQEQLKPTLAALQPTNGNTAQIAQNDAAAALSHSGHFEHADDQAARSPEEVSNIMPQDPETSLENDQARAQRAASDSNTITRQDTPDYSGLDEQVIEFDESAAPTFPQENDIATEEPISQSDLPEIESGKPVQNEADRTADVTQEVKTAPVQDTAKPIPTATIQPSPEIAIQPLNPVNPGPVDAPMQTAAPQAQSVLNMSETGWEARLISEIETLVEQNVEKAELVLNPDDLGNLEISLEISDGQIKVNIGTSTEQAARLFESNVAQLSSIFSEAGLNLTQHNAQNQNDAQDQETAQSQKPSPEREDDTQTDNTKPNKPSDSLVDVTA